MHERQLISDVHNEDGAEEFLRFENKSVSLARALDSAESLILSIRT